MMRDHIDTQEAIRLYRVWQNWREVAMRMIRANGMAYNAAAIGNAVRRYDLGEAS